MAADGLHATALAEQCSRLFPCLADRVRRSKWGLKVALVLLHVIFVGVLFLLDADLIRKTKEEPWYTAIYLGFLVATLVQYFFTSGSSPGYVVDAMRVGNEMCTTSVNSPMLLNQSISRNNSFTSSMNRNQLGRRNYGMNSSSWLKLVMDLYPPGSSIRNWTCTYCNIIQPPRSKHCHDCDKCVLQFDHHCVWLGTCIGQGNHCRFWWYIFEESILCTWTVVLYIDLLSSKIIKDCYLVLTNQTTYELVRRRRILYLRGIPERVHPFSRGICKNLYVFCCSRDGKYSMEAVPTMEELEAKARPYTCMDIMSCRCC
ncbi:protein S-acyltransferase 10 isoform X3 [Elaeis guineensis]|uniref:S-acyltransferase n=1 Tax=Elaeis guineensis var. tenera TaxID=51953 RepID=A0A6I9R5S5_ELAGV|nr:protein S-acyltransferase 10 isoform X3 [Elaeis guineensis]